MSGATPNDDISRIGHRHSLRLGGDPGAGAGLPGLGGRQCSRHVCHLPRRRVAAFCRRGSEQLLHRRRHEYPLHHPQHPGGAYHLGVQRQLYRPRDRNRQTHAAVRAVLSCHVPRHDGIDECGAHRQQHRPDVGWPGNGDLDYRGHGRHLPHAVGHRSGMEIFHPRQRRHFARLLRHHPDLSCRPESPWRRGSGNDLEPAAGCRATTRRLAAQSRVHLPAHRLRHQGGPGAASCLAA